MSTIRNNAIPPFRAVKPDSMKKLASIVVLSKRTTAIDTHVVCEVTTNTKVSSVGVSVTLLCGILLADCSSLVVVSRTSTFSYEMALMSPIIVVTHSLNFTLRKFHLTGFMASERPNAVIVSGPPTAMFSTDALLCIRIYALYNRSKKSEC